MKDTFQFKKDCITGEVLLQHIGRFALASGNNLRMIFSPEGLRIVIGKSSLENGDVLSYEDPECNLGILPLTE